MLSLYGNLSSQDTQPFQKMHVFQRKLDLTLYQRHRPIN